MELECYNNSGPSLVDNNRMKKSQLTTNYLSSFSLESLLELYERSAVKHGAYHAEGDYRKTNREHDNLVNLYSEFKHRGLEAQRSLLDFINSDVLSVRVWAAFHALDFAPDIAEPALQYIVQNAHGVPTLHAEIILKEWKSGNLNFDV